MNNTKFIVNGKVLTVERSFNAPLDLVWRTWTEAELLDQWWAPKPWRSVTKSMDFKNGGHRLYAMVGPNGEEHWGKTSYINISARNHFSGEDAFTDNEGNINKDLPVAQFQNQFERESGNTKVVITTEYASEEHLKQVIDMGMKEGLTMTFENLDDTLKKLKL